MSRRDRSDPLEGEDRTVPPHAEIIDATELDAVVFELDGVITNTVELHFQAWKETFDTLLRTREGRGFTPFTRQEFREHVDGKTRKDAIETFLRSRRITLPLGEPLPEADEALTRDTDSIFGLEKMKQALFDQRIESGQLNLDDDAVDLIHRLIRADIRLGVVSPSHRTARILSILDIQGMFDTIVDAQIYADEDLAGKPTGDIFNEAITRLGATKDRTAIIEDDRPAIEAGRGAGFGRIVVVADDPRERKKFLARGADLVVDSLDTLKVRNEEGHYIRSRP